MAAQFLLLQFFVFGYDGSVVSKSAEDCIMAFATFFIFLISAPSLGVEVLSLEGKKPLSFHLRDKRIKWQKTNKNCLKSQDFGITNNTFSYTAFSTFFSLQSAFLLLN